MATTRSQPSDSTCTAAAWTTKISLWRYAECLSMNGVSQQGMQSHLRRYAACKVVKLFVSSCGGRLCQSNKHRCGFFASRSKVMWPCNGIPSN